MQIGTYLAKKGYKVTVFAPGVEIRDGYLLPELKGKLYHDEIVRGVRIIRPRCLQDFRRSMWRRLLFEVVFALSVAFLLWKAKRPDLIVGAYPPAVLPSLGLLISKVLRVPYIFEIRDLMADALKANNYSRSKVLTKFAAKVENLVYIHCDHIITVSDGIKKIIESKGVSRAKITVVKNGYEPQVFEEADFSFDPRVQFGWGDKFVVIYAGGLTQSYDIESLLKAAVLTREDLGILYVIVGEGEKKSQYINYRDEKGLNNVQFLDAVPRRKIPAILGGANVGVHLFSDNPLWSYVLGNKPFDYLGSGIPMIFSGMGDTADLVNNSGGGFVVHPEHPQELAEKICWLRDNPRLAIEMGTRGQKYVQVNFNRFTLLEDLDCALESVLG
jgi:glycosyltransferase involved in cell wall biosynthesis